MGWYFWWHHERRDYDTGGPLTYPVRAWHSVVRRMRYEAPPDAWVPDGLADVNMVPDSFEVVNDEPMVLMAAKHAIHDARGHATGSPLTLPVWAARITAHGNTPERRLITQRRELPGWIAMSQIARAEPGTCWVDVDDSSLETIEALVTVETDYVKPGGPHDAGFLFGGWFR